MSASRKTIVVVGATGNQGSSVAKTFLSLPNWTVRCVTRNPASAVSETLRSQGAEIVQADLTEPASLPKVLEGANAVFVNTDYWGVYRPALTALLTEGKDPEPASKKAYDNETTCGKNIVDAAAAIPTLERFVYSALMPMARASNGKYKRSLHMETKAWVVDYIEKEQPELAKKSSFIYLGGYNTNPMLTPRYDPNSGKHIFMLAGGKDTRMPIVDPKESTGPFVRALIEDEAPGTKLLAVDDDSYLTLEEMINTWSKATGKDAIFVPSTIQVMHEKFGVPYETLEALAFVVEYGYTGGVDGIIEPSQLKNKPKTKSFADWLKEKNNESAL